MEGQDDFELPGVPDAFQRLWNPHRAAYQARGQDQVTGSNDCPFCLAPTRSDEDSLIVYRGQSCFVLLNLYPYNPGHLLVCPYRHVPDLTDLNDEETLEFTTLSQQAMRTLATTANPAGFNLGINQGKVGGAGIAAHLHQHVVPRWNGDTNFMPIIAQTKNLSATLGDVRQQVSAAWESAGQAWQQDQERKKAHDRQPQQNHAQPGQQGSES